MAADQEPVGDFAHNTFSNRGLDADKKGYPHNSYIENVVDQKLGVMHRVIDTSPNPAYPRTREVVEVPSPVLSEKVTMAEEERALFRKQGGLPGEVSLTAFTRTLLGGSVGLEGARSRNYGVPLTNGAEQTNGTRPQPNGERKGDNGHRINNGSNVIPLRRGKVRPA